MKKKISCFIVVTVILLICVIVYFKPLSLTDMVDESHQITMTLNEFGIRDGESYIDTTDYKTFTTGQKSAIVELLKKYPYRRTATTLFSDGSISETADRLLFIHVYDDDSVIGAIFVSSSGEVVVNDKLYRMKHADRFIEQIMEIVMITD